jgi:hypothetical protein
MQTVLVVEKLVRVEAAGTGALARARMTNTSAREMSWAERAGGTGVVAPGEAFEVAVTESGAGGVQLVSGDALAATLTLSLCEGAAGHHLLAQVLVGG